MDLKLLDVEDRPVILLTVEGISRAFVWIGDQWLETPGMIGKSMLDGIRLTPERFSIVFPDADFELFTQIPIP